VVTERGRRVAPSLQILYAMAEWYFLQDGIAGDYNSSYAFLVLRHHGQVAIIRPESFPYRIGQIRCQSSGAWCPCRRGPLVLVHVP
jgi:hypothetical protein